MKPKVLIVGAGIGGLFLGNLLQLAGVRYEIFERAPEVKPLGIYEEFTKIGKVGIFVEAYANNLNRQYVLNYTDRIIVGGSLEYVVARRDLYDLLRRQVPEERIHMNKKVYCFDQDDYGVTIHCADNTSYHGDILVGADGAHSIIRRHLYKALKVSGKLPPSDDVPLPFRCGCLVGQTEVLDPEEFPDLKLPLSQFLCVHGDNVYTWATFTTSRNTMCWMVIEYLNKKKVKPDDSAAHNAEWGPLAAQAMSLEVRDLKIPGGRDGRTRTIGDLLDRTPKDLISKVMLEEKVFDTWHGGRVVLLGDGTLNPAGGAGALTAIHDAVALANWINTLESPTLSDLDTVFKEYHEERHPVAEELLASSQVLNRVGGKTVFAVVMRTVIKHVPKWIWRKYMIKISEARPQVSFLPLVDDTGTARPAYQPSLHKTLAILRARGDYGEIGSKAEVE
ncbi:hypothetical protein BGZ59_001204 [Podila verticillata]|nr:hypothetical protein BGZ59_001204 [Podila verticillata]